MRPALHFNAGAAAIDIRNPPGEHYYGSWTGVAISGHERSFDLQQSAIELTLPSCFNKWQGANQIDWLRIDSDFELVDLGANDELCLRALEFRPQLEPVTIGQKRCGRR